MREVYWTFGCGLSLISAVLCATFGTFLDIHLVARAQLYCAGDLSSGERFAGTLWILSCFAGPVLMILYDLATEGTPGDCVLPRGTFTPWARTPS
ncbi:hypothetical protein ACFQQB_18150 [Nonomuraea rubra]|uniref:hypothetical protein n=1 Tax=Nonomuraea rubra TaxID=46180 RepID=UPI0033841AFA